MNINLVYYSLYIKRGKIRPFLTWCRNNSSPNINEVMATNICTSLGPIRSRLKNRIKETTEIILKNGGQDVTSLKHLRSKLTANINTHQVCFEKLCNLQNVDVGEKEAVENEVETSTELVLDANETLHSLEEFILIAETVRDADSIKLEQQKHNLELEKLKLENDYKRMQLDKLKIEKETSIVVDIKKQKIKLPEIPLPTFSGNIIEWPTFWDSFKSTIHSNTHVAKIDKFKYLMAQLEGDAKSTLCGFELTEGHYDQAIELLKERYDDSEHIIHHHYKILSEIPRCVDETTELRKTINLLESQIRSLQSMGESVDNNHMISLFMSKLPETINLRLEETRYTKWTLQLLRKAVNKLVIAREKSEETDVSVKTNSCFYPTEGLLSYHAKINCCFCGKSHWSDECQEFRTVNNRKEIIPDRCFVCLAKTHVSRNCFSTKPCFYCKEKGVHHSALCPQKFGEVPVDILSVPATLGEEIQGNQNPDVIMKTAKLTVYNPLTGQNRILTALMDTGAKKTYLTEDAANTIQLKCGPSRINKLNTFSSSASSTMITKETEIMIGQRNGLKKKMKVNVCNTITGTLVRPKVDVEKYRTIWNDLELADEIPKRCTKFDIDLLIGNDYYDEIINSEKIYLGDGLYLINSTLGWIFSGRVMSQECIPEDCFSMLVEEVDISKKVWESESIGVQDISDESELNGYRGSFLSAEKTNDDSNDKDDSNILMNYDQIVKKQVEEGISVETNCKLDNLQNNRIVGSCITHHIVKKTLPAEILVESRFYRVIWGVVCAALLLGFAMQLDVIRCYQKEAGMNARRLKCNDEMMIENINFEEQSPYAYKVLSKWDVDELQENTLLQELWEQSNRISLLVVGRRWKVLIKEY